MTILKHKKLESMHTTLTPAVSGKCPLEENGSADETAAPDNTIALQVFVAESSTIFDVHRR